jgi:hypothetical protein
VLALATADIDELLRRNRDVIDRAFPGRARDLRSLLEGAEFHQPSRGIALIDPRTAGERGSSRAGSMDGDRWRRIGTAPRRSYECQREAPICHE